MKVSVHPVFVTVPESKTPRSPGVHVSSIIRGIAVETGILKPEWVEELSLVEVNSSTRFSDPVVALRVSMGLAWEEWYIREVLGPEGVIDHPGEMHYDGVYMSPDGQELTTIIVGGRTVMFGPNRGRVIGGQNKYKPKIHEVKLTYKSVRTVGMTEGELLNQFMWLAQIKAYCLAARTNLADLHVLYVCGDYSYPISPSKYRYQIEFEQSELEDNWEMLAAYRDLKLGGE